MNPKTLMITILVIVVAIVAYSMVTSPSIDEKLLPPSDSKEKLPPPPEIKKGEKQPNAVTESVDFDFGSQARYETGRHKFKIYNKGEAPLELTQGDSSCKCTIGSLDKNVVAPGEFTEVELEWTPESVSTAGSSDKFRQYAVVYTNDPDRPEIGFNITGFVYMLFEIIPEKEWPLGEMTMTQTKTVTGRITSLLDPFKIESIETTSEFITAEPRQLTDEELKLFEIKNGYEISVTVQPGFNYGTFEESLILQTDYKEGTEVRIHVQGFIKGPFTFLKTSRQKGILWSANSWMLDMGSFAAQEGRKVDMRVFVAELDQMPEGENFKVLSAETDLEFLRVNVTGDDQPAENDRLELQMQFEYVAGSPAVLRTAQKPVTVTLRTNHPEAKEFKIRVLFSAN
ncbi:hypothetical protein Pla110_16440 [Polystyrenella longa]|uniref:DUF1573 domain-containing protein n=1 Tax=Polystyrenella longa TaxID=2528007 RepID=A0A518CL72_9PLAN|nr:DUF1573 domain-containing protein [Polystyrenella longa]QDU79924.1 hypothetical protein Pla110_16440 [Polystyrenella longa]